MDSILLLIARLNLIGTSDMKSTPPAIAVSIIPACMKPATEIRKPFSDTATLQIIHFEYICNILPAAQNCKGNQSHIS